MTDIKNYSIGEPCIQYFTTNLSQETTMIKSLAFTLPPKPPVFGEIEERDLCRRVVSRVSSGSVLIQIGQYLTKQDVVARKKDLLSRHSK